MKKNLFGKVSVLAVCCALALGVAGCNNSEEVTEEPVGGVEEEVVIDEEVVEDALENVEVNAEDAVEGVVEDAEVAVEDAVENAAE